MERPFSFSLKYLPGLALVFSVLSVLILSHHVTAQNTIVQDPENIAKERARYDFPMPAEVVNALFHNDGLFQNFDPKDELKDKRSGSAKHFRNPDGSITAIIGAGPVHYEEDGVWKTIMTHILLNRTQDYQDYKYAVVHNEHKIYFPHNPGKPIISIINGQVYKDWGQPGMVWMDATGTVLSEIPLNTNAAGITNQDQIIYPDMFQAVDAEIRNSIVDRKLLYTLKDSTILNSKPAGAVFLAFRETINTVSDWSLTGTPSGEVGITPTSSGQFLQDIMFVSSSDVPQLQVKQPLYYEDWALVNADGRDSTSTHPGSYFVTKSKSGHDVYTMIPVSWLTHVDREFPLIIDPTTNYYPDPVWTYVPTTTTYRGGNSGSYYCVYTTSWGRWNNYDLSYGWVDDTWPTSNPYLDGGATFNLTDLCDDVTITAVTHYWYHYGERNCGTDISLKFGMVQNNHHLAEESACNTWGVRIRANNNYYSGTGYNSNGWKSRTGSTTDITNALSVDQISIGWAYNGGDDCCTCCCFCTISCTGNDGNYHHVYGYAHATLKPYIAITYTSPFDKVWTGAISTSWTNGSNWCPVGVPTVAHKVLIPGSTPNEPTLATSESVSCITIYSTNGALVTISTGTLNVASGTCPNYP